MLYQRDEKASCLPDYLFLYTILPPTIPDIFLSFYLTRILVFLIKAQDN